MIDVHGRQVLHVLFGDVEADTVVDPRHGADRDSHVVAAPQVPLSNGAWQELLFLGGIEFLEPRQDAAEPDLARRSIDKPDRNKPAGAMPMLRFDHGMDNRQCPLRARTEESPQTVTVAHGQRVSRPAGHNIGR
jgi:hypothetical protein